MTFSVLWKRHYTRQYCAKQYNASTVIGFKDSIVWPNCCDIRIEANKSLLELQLKQTRDLIYEEWKKLAGS